MNTRKSLKVSILLPLALLLSPIAAFAAFVSGSTGADGDFTPTVNTVLQIPESGVFNFGTVTIPSGVTVTFQKNTQNMPVSILATGDVTVSGSINVNGTNATNNIPGSGGAGGFDGGTGGYSYAMGYRGQGPGGGGGGLATGQGGSAGGGGFGGGGGAGNLGSRYFCNNVDNQYAVGSGNGAGGALYGNAGLIPLIGGSGGGGAAGVSSISGGGGGGGGAILIASSGTIRVDGTITANGGNGSYFGNYYASNNYLFYNAGGGGSGGGIRLVANTITGEGAIYANGGTSSYVSSCTGNSQYTYRGGDGAGGRVRLDAWTINRANNSSPAYTTSYPTALYPAAVPSLAITQVVTQAGTTIGVPAAPVGAFRPPDVVLPFNTSGPVTVTVSAQNIPVSPAKTITIKAMPESGSSIVTATGTLAGSDSSSSTQVQLTLTGGMSYVLSASVNF